MQGLIVDMGLTLFFLGIIAAFVFPALGIGGRNTVRVSRRAGSMIVSALGVPMSLSLLGIVTVAIGMYLP